MNEIKTEKQALIMILSNLKDINKEIKALVNLKRHQLLSQYAIRLEDSKNHTEDKKTSLLKEYEENLKIIAYSDKPSK